MDQIKTYRETIKRLLREREAMGRPFLPNGLEVTCLFDDASEQYGLMSIGWMQGERVNGAILLLRIKNGKIWVEEDATDAPIAEDLAQSGIPREDIVLGFQPPELRAHTAFAAA